MGSRLHGVCLGGENKLWLLLEKGAAFWSSSTPVLLLWRRSWEAVVEAAVVVRVVPVRKIVHRRRRRRLEPLHCGGVKSTALTQPSSNHAAVGGVTALLLVGGGVLGGMKRAYLEASPALRELRDGRDGPAEARGSYARSVAPHRSCVVRARADWSDGLRRLHADSSGRVGHIRRQGIVAEARTARRSVPMTDAARAPSYPSSNSYVPLINTALVSFSRKMARAFSVSPRCSSAENSDHILFEGIHDDATRGSVTACIGRRLGTKRQTFKVH